MLKIYLLIPLFYCFSSQGQTLTDQWNYTYGGTDTDASQDFIKTCDGGFLIAGSTISSADCTITQTSRGMDDYWIVKLNKNGSYQWDKRYGGDKNDVMSRIIHSNDGGYLLCGFSFSGISFEKTESNFDVSQSSADIWIIKIDSLGNKIWDKTYGGTSDDGVACIASAWDGGYLIGGSSKSSISGNKTAIPFDSFGDGWLVKIDENGNILWQKCYGGTNVDDMVGITKTGTSGYLLEILSLSNASGNKSENNFDPTLATRDNWVVRIDNMGNIIWDKTIGGNQDEWQGNILSFHNNEAFISCISFSSVSGTKICPNKSIAPDFWVVKIDNAGNIEWDKTYGTVSQEDGRCRSYLTSDDKIIISGNSFSMLPNGDKSEPNLTTEQTWILAIDKNGNKIWDKTIQQGFSPSGGGWPTHTTGTVETTDHCFVTVNFTDAGVGGDKTQPSKGGLDYFILKFCDADLVNHNIVYDCGVPVSTQILLTNVFTPNGDGINDELIFTNLPELTSLVVFNRWGSVMFEKDSYQNDWTANGISDGVYFYLLKLANGEVIKGTLQIIR